MVLALSTVDTSRLKSYQNTRLQYSPTTEVYLHYRKLWRVHFPDFLDARLQSARRARVLSKIKRRLVALLSFYRAAVRDGKAQVPSSH